jgi:Virulence factor BrkB
VSPQHAMLTMHCLLRTVGRPGAVCTVSANRPWPSCRCKPPARRGVSSACATTDSWQGALATALLFTSGKALFGLYLGTAAVVPAYGAAGSLIVVILWVYYPAMIFYFGAALTRVRAG